MVYSSSSLKLVVVIASAFDIFDPAGIVKSDVSMLTPFFNTSTVIEDPVGAVNTDALN
jgi:hypothetical protein